MEFNLEQMVEESVNHLEADFYQKKFHFSYSSISKLLYSPAVFYQMYVLGHKEIRTDKHLVEGSLIHNLLLEPEKFHEQFVTLPSALPKDKAKQLVDSVFYKVELQLRDNPDVTFQDCETYILEVMQEMNYFQALKTDGQRLEKVITTENSNYFEFLKTRGSRDIIDEEMFTYCQSAVDIIKQHPEVLELLGQDDTGRDIEVFNELPVEVSMSKFSFGLKGIIDNLVIDHDKKMININDFKTSSKDLSSFKDSVEYYNYWMQAVMYMLMVSHKYQKLIEEGYELHFRFIVIDRFFNVYPFKVSDTSSQAWLTRFDEVLNKVNYHYESKRFQLPYEFDKGLVIL